MQTVEEYVQKMIDANNELMKMNKSSNPHKNISSNLDMLEDLVLFLAKEIDKLKD